MYVKFDQKTGTVIGVRGKEYTEENSIPVELAEVQDILDGIVLADEYEVRYNTKLKQMEFAKRNDNKIVGNSINDFIYEMPVKLIEDPDIIVVQDIVNTCWKIHIGARLGSSLRNKGVGISDRMMLSITAKGDPNVLYKTLFVELSDIVRNNYVVLPFTMLFESTSQPISVYTSRRFDTYQFKRIFNE